MCRLYGGAVSPDSALVYIDRMETALAAETREVTCALWHASLACTYLPANNRYGTIGGMTAEEMRQRSRQHFLSSIAAPDVLAQTSASTAPSWATAWLPASPLWAAALPTPPTAKTPAFWP